MPPSGDGYVVARVAGKCMEARGIPDGSFVYADAGLEPRTGDAVVAEVGGELLVKEYSAMGAVRYLRPACGRYPAFTAVGMRVLGVVVAAVVPIARVACLVLCGDALF